MCCSRFAFQCEVHAEALSIGAQQAIEIVRALESGARIVIMDEPTAALATTLKSKPFTDDRHSSYP